MQKITMTKHTVFQDDHLTTSYYTQIIFAFCKSSPTFENMYKSHNDFDLIVLRSHKNTIVMFGKANLS